MLSSVLLNWFDTLRARRWVLSVIFDQDQRECVILYHSSVNLFIQQILRPAVLSTSALEEEEQAGDSLTLVKFMLYRRKLVLNKLLQEINKIFTYLCVLRAIKDIKRKFDSPLKEGLWRYHAWTESSPRAYQPVSRTRHCARQREHRGPRTKAWHVSSWA